MRHTDGRKLDLKTLETLRIRAVQQVMDGESPEVVIKALGMILVRPESTNGWLLIVKVGLMR